MKTLLFIVALLLIQIELFAQPCPLDYEGPSTVTIQICEGCSIQATWCCGTIASPVGNKPAIHFSDILLIGDCTFCLEWMQHSNGHLVPSIPWERLIGAVVYSEEFCFDPTPELPPCNDPQQAKYNMVVTNGGCYRLIQDMETKRYVPCSAGVQELCYEEYIICYEIINGLSNLKVEGLGKLPSFTCADPNCFPLCN
ncbi:MAG: hypothetical protein CVV22_12960 [Ignavibacteriae bacterium HGW-Ignavibacteriae-1]|jgi:hypothetical protein|nr:MAG: hypothetical protein CVV22_12960 [Ignavibacteriae bacterium HGW-Ignavibacteriae-1]